MKITEIQKKTAADKKSIGFDYQFLYFIYRALELKPGEKLGYEVKDDIHIELNDGIEILIQLKHSLQTNTSDDIINMTEKDMDLWKSLYNWNTILNEYNDEERDEFLKNTEFVLVTNKNNKNNKFFVETSRFRNNEIEVDEYKRYIEELHNGITGTKEHSKKLKMYMKSLMSQDNNILSKFVNKLNFTFGFDDLIDKIKMQILSKHIDKRKLDDIFERCIGNLSIWKYDQVKKGERVFIDFEEIDNRIKHCFIYGRSNKFPRKDKIDIKMPLDLNNQYFVKELLEIEDIFKDSYINIVKYTTLRLKIENLLEAWIQDNYVTETDKEQFVSECITLWSNFHRKHHRSCDRAISKGVDSSELEELKLSCALECLDSIRIEKLDLCGEQLSMEESNGAFYSLSEQQEIGWLYRWREKYKK